MASIGIGDTPVRAPGCEPSPNELLKNEPSSVMLFNRLSCPANDEPLDWGVRRVKSVIVRPMVGKAAIASFGMVVDAPVMRELSAPPVAVTCTPVNVTATVLSSKLTSVDEPRVTSRPFWTLRSYPSATAVTAYGPPTRMAGIRKRPSARVIA